ncbi:potassium channel subfamily K member 2-like isoform X2 [Mercenaria mercenaria]|uniref:potassium channel subfamily K member 2-like isoform X2 n=1 Tax=Mercenaria mercenaria TaxID=6596 RepID=UPI00234F7893|nr:potassium channel subfamily K member 2-like isoform X2 [Mercenaria mercenaria]
MHWLTLCILQTIFFVYLLVGGAIFMALEKDHEDEISSNQSARFSQFLTNNTCVTASELSTFATSVIEAYDSGVVATSDTSSTSNWDYGPSVFFSATVVTSIGYGHISPTTTGGQVFFVFYAILGIPLTALILGAVGEKMTKPYKKLEKKQFFPKYPKTETVGKRAIFATLCFVLFSLIPAAIFQAVEDWSYLEAWYYTIVTLTTVGFGDFVPGQSDSDIPVYYKLVVSAWIFFGLAWLSMMLNLVGDFFKVQANKINNAQDITEIKEVAKSDGTQDGTELTEVAM